MAENKINTRELLVKQKSEMKVYNKRENNSIFNVKNIK
jgi:hypothetical protein